MNLSDFAISNIRGSDYRCLIFLISKNEAINVMQKADLTGKSGNIIEHKNLFSYSKCVKKF